MAALLPGGRPASAAAALLLQQHDPWQGALGALEGGRPLGRSADRRAGGGLESEIQECTYLWGNLLASALPCERRAVCKQQARVARCPCRLQLAFCPPAARAALLPPCVDRRPRLLFQYKPYCQQEPLNLSEAEVAAVIEAVFGPVEGQGARSVLQVGRGCWAGGGLGRALVSGAALRGAARCCACLSWARGLQKGLQNWGLQGLR